MATKTPPASREVRPFSPKPELRKLDPKPRNSPGNDARKNRAHISNQVSLLVVLSKYTSATLSPHIRRILTNGRIPVAMADAEELALRAQLAELERERETLKGILELEAMKRQLLKGCPIGPRAAWGEPELRDGGAAPDVPSTVTTIHAPDLSAEDKKRLAALLASDADDDDNDDDDDDDDDDAHFDSQSPAEMAATLARMEDELAELTLLRDQDELLLLKAQLAALQASAPQ